jgi:hypothetical protein
MPFDEQQKTQKTPTKRARSRDASDNPKRVRGNDTSGPIVTIPVLAAVQPQPAMESQQQQQAANEPQQMGGPSMEDMRILIEQMREQMAQTQRENEELRARVQAQRDVPAPAPAMPQPTQTMEDMIPWGTANRRIPSAMIFGVDRISYRSWRLEVLTNGEVYQLSFPSAKARVIWAYGQLGGKPKVAMEQWLEEYVRRERFAGADFEEFLQRCDEFFDDRDARRKRSDQFYSMRQGKRGFREFLGDWMVAYRAAQLNLSEDSLERALSEAMNPELLDLARATLLMIPTWDGKLAHLKALADMTENKRGAGNNGNSGGRPRGGLNQQRQQQQTGGYSSNHNNNGGSTHQNHHANQLRDPDEMDWEPTLASGRRAKWISEEERQKRRDNGWCVRCGGKDHYVRDCPHMPALRPLPSDSGLRSKDLGRTRGRPGKTIASGRHTRVIEYHEDGLEQEKTEEIESHSDEEKE